MKKILILCIISLLSLNAENIPDGKLFWVKQISKNTNIPIKSFVDGEYSDFIKSQDISILMNLANIENRIDFEKKVLSVREYYNSKNNNSMDSAIFGLGISIIYIVIILFLRKVVWRNIIINKKR